MTRTSFDAREHNCVFVGDERYFVLESEERLFLVLDKCPHRGGPLSLGRRSEDGERVICPWHGTRASCAVLRRKSLPLVRRGTAITAYLPAEAGGAESVFLAQRRVLANLPASADGAEPAVDGSGNAAHG
jgi:Rieske [2Fe-2S] domain